MATVLEIACNSAASALAAERGGADRIELFTDLAAGGTTPSAGTLAVVRDRVRLPVHVLVRPRPGDFVYDEVALAVMLEDIAVCRRLGCDGIVTGALTAEGQVDIAACTVLRAAAGPLPLTFHRAFDRIQDRAAALDTLIALGFQRVLSSGGQPTALQGAATLSADRAHSQGRITVMAGAGLTPHTIGEVARLSGCSELHASATVQRAGRMCGRAPSLPGLEDGYLESDAAVVAALRAAWPAR